MPETHSTSADVSEDQKATDAPPSVIDAAADLVETVVTYARQEAGDLVHDKAVIPLQMAGTTAALALAIAVAVVMGVMFFAAGALILLAQLIGWPYALFAVGGVLIVVSLVIAIVRLRSVQK